MMIDPPIDKLIEKTPGRYALVCGLAKRAKELNATETADIDENGEKPLSRAAREIYEGKIVLHIDEPNK